MFLDSGIFIALMSRKDRWHEPNRCHPNRRMARSPAPVCHASRWRGNPVPRLRAGGILSRTLFLLPARESYPAPGAETARDMIPGPAFGSEGNYRDACRNNPEH